MRTHEPQAPRTPPAAPASAHQLDLGLDHPRLKGLAPSERRTVLTQLARLMLEARGLASATTQEDGDEHV